MLGADEALHFWTLRFENDVKTYGTQTGLWVETKHWLFENDVKTYGTQTKQIPTPTKELFENDVKTYGTQTIKVPLMTLLSLRMM